jgi:hypothetical protein
VSLVNNGTHGYNLVASATTFLRENVEILVDPPAGYIGRDIAILGMPRVTIWARQSVGAIAGQFSIQFSISDSAGVKEWLDLMPPIATPFDVPILTQVTVPAKFIRLVATRPGGQATTIQFAVMAAM